MTIVRRIRLVSIRSYNAFMHSSRTSVHGVKQRINTEDYITRTKNLISQYISIYKNTVMTANTIKNINIQPRMSEHFRIENIKITIIY